MASKGRARPAGAAARATWSIAVTFPKFAKIPLELQLMVWRFALPGPRIIQPKYPIATEARDLRRRHPGRSRRSMLKCSSKIPAMLHTCRNSRKIALKVYSVAFGGAFCNRGPIYFDFNLDTLYLRHSRTLTSIEKTYAGAKIDDDRQDFTKRLQNIMLECPASQGVAGTLSKLEGLKNVTLQIDTSDDSRQAAMNRIQFEIAYSNKTKKRDREAWEKLKVTRISKQRMLALRVAHQDGFPKHLQPTKQPRQHFTNRSSPLCNRLAQGQFEREI